MVGLAACSTEPPLADPAAAATRAEQARLEVLLATDLGPDAWTPATCDVEVLRIERPTTWAQVRCAVAAEDNGGVEGSWAAPIRVDGDRVTEPRDGSEFEPSLRAAFPPDLADYVLEHAGEATR